MERSFNNRELEEIVRKNADQYRMIPSEKVWKGINNSLHSRRKRYVIGIASLLLVTSVAVTWVMLSYPGGRKTVTGQVTVTGNSPVTATAPVKPHSSPAQPLNSLAPFNKFESNNPGESPESSSSPADLVLTNRADATLEITTESSPTAKINKLIAAAPAIKTEPAGVNPEQVHPAGIQNRQTGMLPSGGETRKQSAPVSVYMPLTIESVVNNYHFIRLKKKLTWQFYFTPTVSYRKLNENKSFQSGSSSPFATTNYSYPFSPLRDVNNSVTHKPDMGIEVGMVAKYPLTQSLRLTAGLQFNINRYDIKAFAYYGERATINLSGDNTSLRPWTYYRNYDFDGNKSDWLKNLYFSVSAPIGAELKVLGNKNTWLGMAGTVQPTYIIGDRAYLLSTDYKNYAEAPSLIRHVNVNTSFETFISYKGRTTRWQIGPQVRYQVLSSFKNKYPLRENLFDYGIKIGITLNR